MSGVVLPYVNQRVRNEGNVNIRNIWELIHCTQIQQKYINSHIIHTLTYNSHFLTDHL